MDLMKEQISNSMADFIDNFDADENLKKTVVYKLGNTVKITPCIFISKRKKATWESEFRGKTETKDREIGF